MSYENLEDYTFFDAKDVLITHDSDWNVIAYGVPDSALASEPEPESEPIGVQMMPLKRSAEKAAEQAPVDDEPLPQPKHTPYRPGGPECLACEWADLKNKIRDAS